MAIEEHLEVFVEGPDAWNEWRADNPAIAPDLSEVRLDLSSYSWSSVDFSRADLSGAALLSAYLPGASFAGADLSKAYVLDGKLEDANFSGANLSGAHLVGADFFWADLSGADLSGANLYEADLANADFSGANLSGADLTKAVLVETKLSGADLTGCRVYGISAWGLELDDTTKQNNLIITGREDISEPTEEPVVTVDNLELAQFVYLLLHNEKIRDVIDTITSKVVLILGRFSDERKPVLEGIRNALRASNLTPILFDFDKPRSKDLTGTVETLARMARFIVADVTDPSSVPHELATIVPHMRTTPIVPIRLSGSGGYSMLDDLERSYQWVLPIYEYEGPTALIAALDEKIIEPADAKAKELRRSD